MLTIGDRIKYFRTRRGLTQAQLAQCTGIHPVSIRKYETNKMQPQLSQIEKIADALCLSTSALTGSYSEIIKLDLISSSRRGLGKPGAAYSPANFSYNADLKAEVPLV